jgi:hypothetical protein
MSAGNETNWTGEAGYVNCLLTTLAQGPKKSVSIVADRPVPALPELAAGNSDLSTWVSKLSFDYAALNTAKVAQLLRSFAGFRWYSLFKTKGVIESVVLDTDNRPVLCRFEIELRKSGRGPAEVHVTAKIA